ncbi:MAG: hypothetical protein Sapg2KO_44020 [Saprospiraceae bacterium]
MTLKYLSKIFILLGIILPGLVFSQNCFSLKIDQLEASPGDTVALNVSATGFQSILSMQYSMKWNASELELAGIGNFNLSGLSESNFSLTPTNIAAGQLGLAWFDPSVQGVAMADNESLYTLTFIVKQFSGERSFIEFSEQPTPSEITFAPNNAVSLPVGLAGAVHLKFENQVYDPLLITGACAQPTGCGAFSGGVNVTVSGGTAPYAYDWDGPSGFVSNTANLDSLSPGAYQLRVIDAEGNENFAKFNVSNTGGEGSNFFVGIAIECNDTTDTAKLFAASFGTDTVGLSYAWSNGVVDSSVSFSSTIEVPLSGTYNVTVTDANGCQSVSESVRPAEICEDRINPVVVSIENVAAAAGDTATVLVTGNNINDLTQLSFSIGWDQLDLQLIEATPNAALATAVVSNDSINLGFNWTSSQAVSIGNAPILTLKFIVGFDSGVANLRLNGFPNSLFARGEGQENIAIITNDGSITVGAADPVQLNIASGIFGSGEEVCIPVSVANFNRIVGMQFQLAWDTTALQFSQVKSFALPQFSEINFGLELAEVSGRISASWVDNNLAGQTLADNAVLFEICFTPKNVEDSTIIWVDETNFPVEFINKDLATLPYTSKIGMISIIQKVWPGDTDINGIVNHFDLFNIGLAFSEMGPKRAEASTNWAGEFSIPWAGATPGTHVNYRFADTNGDGVVSELDEVAIEQNWGRTYELPTPGFAPLQPRRNGAPLFLKVDTLYTGARVDIPIHFGTEDNPAQDVYSIGFSIEYDPSVIEPGTFDLSLEDSWLETSGTPLLQVSKSFPAAGRIDIAITRTNGQNISGFGVIGRSSVTIEDVIFGVRDGKPFEFKITNARTINVAEEEASVTPQTTTARVELASATVQLLPDHLVEVYPVPTSDVLQVQLPQALKVQRLELFDLNGRQLLQVVPSGVQHTLDLSALSSGIYNLKVIAESGVLIKRISKK